jgi:hypothetical protein
LIGERWNAGTAGPALRFQLFLSLCLLASPSFLFAQDSTTTPSTAEILSGQELIYRGHFGAAQVYFADLSQRFPSDAAGPALEASALIWWGEAQGNESFQFDAIDSLLSDAIGRAKDADTGAADDAHRVPSLFWLGTAYGYRARQAEMRGNAWRAARDAHAMQEALERAVAIDSTCVDCLLGLGIYDYALARASALARLVARIVGLGGGDVDRALARLRHVADDGTLAKTEARWVYASALLREGDRDPAQHEDGVRRAAQLAQQFPENPVFRRVVPAATEP